MLWAIKVEYGKAACLHMVLNILYITAQMCPHRFMQGRAIANWLSSPLHGGDTLVVNGQPFCVGCGFGAAGWIKICHGPRKPHTDQENAKSSYYCRRPPYSCAVSTLIHAFYSCVHNFSGRTSSAYLDHESTKYWTYMYIGKRQAASSGPALCLLATFFF